MASSEQETFGLSVLEALANGIPVLYTTCPALEGLGLLRARQVPSEVDGMRAEIAAEMPGRGTASVPCPPVEKEYGIEAVDPPASTTSTIRSRPVATGAHVPAQVPAPPARGP